MLAPLLLAVLLTMLAVFVVLRGSARILEVLGIDLLAAMLYLGLAERPVRSRAERGRLQDQLV